MSSFLRLENRGWPRAALLIRASQAPPKVNAGSEVTLTGPSHPLLGFWQIPKSQKNSSICPASESQRQDLKTGLITHPLLSCCLPQPASPKFYALAAHSRSFLSLPQLSFLYSAIFMAPYRQNEQFRKPTLINALPALSSVPVLRMLTPHLAPATTVEIFYFTKLRWVRYKQP